MKRGPDGTEQKSETPVALCASCDRCRQRKTKCDGKRPCGNCAAKYMKKHKLKSIEGVDLALIECVYSPAKRRGPVPGRVSQNRKAMEAAERSKAEMMANMSAFADASQQAAALQQQQQQQQRAALLGQQDASLQQLMLHHQAGGLGGLGAAAALGGNLGADTFGGGAATTTTNASMMNFLPSLSTTSSNGGGGDPMSIDQGPSRRARREAASSPAANAPDTVAAHTHLLHKESGEGNRLRSLYRLSVDELFGLPAIPSDDQYSERVGTSVRLLQKADLQALQAARFAEIALGAMVHNEVSLAMELCNATVHSLRDCVKDTANGHFLFEVARGYFLLGVFRAFRGDMTRYFKYRRVALTHLSHMKKGNRSTDRLFAAVSYLDSWAYMIYNANEQKLPAIDSAIPRVCASCPPSMTDPDFDVGNAPASIASDPKNQMWIQGAPPVYLNNEAPLEARSLDALACAVRSCCDQANSRFANLAAAAAAANNDSGMGEEEEIPSESIMTPTTTAVMAHEDELCSRNMVLSAFTLLQQHEASVGRMQRNQGHHLIISAMDAFLDGGDEDSSGGFTDAQIQSLLSVCNSAVENPLLLHHGGPTYHMVSNAAILLCHLMNGMHAMQSLSSSSSDGGGNSDMEAAVFEEVLDTFLAVRKLLNLHRRKLPVILRCHGIPRPNFLGIGAAAAPPPQEGQAQQPFIDLGETVMCGCRGCQGFVLMACSPCVAAERAKAAAEKRQVEATHEAQVTEEIGELDGALYDLENEFDLDDDVLLGMLSKIITA